MYRLRPKLKTVVKLGVAGGAVVLLVEPVKRVYLGVIARSSTSYRSPLPDSDPLWSSEQHERYFGQHYWRSHSATHVPVSCECSIRLPLYRLKEELQNDPDGLTVAFYRNLWGCLVPKDKGGFMEGERHPAFASPEDINTQHSSKGSSGQAKQVLETIEGSGGDIALRRQWWSSESSTGHQELWFVGARIDRQRGVADVGVRMCGSNTGIPNIVLQTQVQKLVFLAGWKLMAVKEKESTGSDRG